MLNYSTEEEITFVRQKIVEGGKIIATRLEEEIPPQSSESTEPSQLQSKIPHKHLKKKIA